jgi:dTMP kinase
MNGKFITFEGPEGGGKSTQMRMLAEYFDREGIDHVTTREPGGPPISEQIRQIILDPDNPAMTDRTELLLMLASRAQHTEEFIIPQLKSGKVVLCDRYNDSTLAYQSYGRGFPLELAKEMCEFASEGLAPDRTYLFDIDSHVGIERSRKVHKDISPEGEVDRMEAQEIEFHIKVRQGFLDLAREDPQRFLLFDATNPIDQIHAAIVKDIKNIIDR